MKIQLSEHFDCKKLLRFVFPSIVMMIFTSIYGVVDGFFVSNFVGKTPFAAVNLIMPFLMMLGAFGFMLGTGGSAIVSKTLGEDDPERANRYFTMMIKVCVIGGVVLSVLGIIFIRPVAILLGASEAMLEDCVLYGRIILAALTAYMLQNLFQSFMVTAEKPKLGLAVTVAAGVTNMVLDFLFIAVFKWGIAGAAMATALSEVVGGVVPLIYFSRKNSSLLHFTKTKLEVKILLRACTNGSSELMTNISASLVNMLYNFQLMRFAGEDGVAAYGVIMYVNFIFIAIFIGYSIGSAPIVGYNYGSGNTAELKSLFKKSLIIIGVSGVVLTAAAIALSSPLSRLFVGYDEGLFELTKRGLMLYSLSFIICGFNIFGSSFFTALNNGLVSAAISFLRTLIFQIAVVLLLPMLLGIDGVWLSITGAELLALFVTIFFFIKMKSKYHYA